MAWLFFIDESGHDHRHMPYEVRDEVANMFGTDLAALQYRGQGVRAGRAFDTYGIFHVPDPYEPRPAP